MKRFFHVFVCLLASLLIAGCAYAENIIDVETLKSIEQADDFAVRIVSKEVVYDAFGSFSLSGNDALVFTVQNDTDETVTGFTMYVAAYDDAQQFVSLDSSWGISLGAPEAEMMSASGLNIAAKSSDKINLQCSADKFQSVRAIIISYTISDGTTFQNPTAEAWHDAVFADRSVNRTVLDDSELDNFASAMNGRTTDYVNALALKEIEDASSFPLKVVKRALIRGSGGDVWYDDSIELDLQNESDDTIQNIKLYAIAYNENYDPKSLNHFTSIYAQVGELTAEDTSIAPGTTKTLKLACDIGDITGLRVIAASYDTSDGITYENEDAENWVHSVIASATKSLD